MTSVFIDESGELGHKTNWLIIASIETTRPRALEKAIKKIWRAKPHLHKHGELHANSVEDSMKIRVLKMISELDVAIRFVAVEKSRQTKPLENIYYESLATLVQRHKQSQIVIIDKKDTNKKRSRLITDLNLDRFFRNASFEESHKVKQLQAADFVAWAIGRAHELEDYRFMDLIKNKII